MFVKTKIDPVTFHCRNTGNFLSHWLIISSRFFAFKPENISRWYKFKEKKNPGRQCSYMHPSNALVFILFWLWWDEPQQIMQIIFQRLVYFQPIIVKTNAKKGFARLFAFQAIFEVFFLQPPHRSADLSVLLLYQTETHKSK